MTDAARSARRSRPSWGRAIGTVVLSFFAAGLIVELVGNVVMVLLGIEDRSSPLPIGVLPDSVETQPTPGDDGKVETLAWASGIAAILLEGVGYSLLLRAMTRYRISVPGGILAAVLGTAAVWAGAAAFGIPGFLGGLLGAAWLLRTGARLPEPG